ncbi:MAG TPA: ABC transporter permease [Candidatus Eremiobacteraceae bacterium]|nr:ABC transporter permease [Candidatus Eremiobacteraceae bacterium]
MTLRELSQRLTGLLGRRGDDAELRAEISAHIDLAIEESVRKGMPLEEARRQALIQFGGTEQFREAVYEQRTLPVLETFFQDVHFGARMLRKYPGFTLVAVLTLALGIGANTAIFSLVDSMLLRPLPFADPHKLVSLTGTYPKGAFVALRDQVRSLDVAAYAEGHEFNLTGQGEPVRLTGTLVSAEFFMVLSARPQIGRPFTPGDDRSGQDNYVILSHALWQERFASDASIVGRNIELEGVSRQVLGVMPADFRFPSAKTQVWIPLHNDASDTVAYWAGDFMPILGRLRRDATIPQARAEVRLFQSGVGKLFPWPMPRSWNADISVVELKDDMVSDVRLRLILLLGAVGLILLIACVNVANLTLSRATTREKEMAVRLVMGADRRRIIRQLLTESVLLALCGGFLGLLLATQGLQLLKFALPPDTPRLADAQIDWRVLVFTGGLAILTGLLFGLAPALQSSRATIAGTLNAVTRGAGASISHRLRGALAVAEIALAVLLIVSAGLLIRSFWGLSHVNPGFQVTRVLSARVTPNQSFCNDPRRCVSFYNELVNRIDAVPGVTSSSLINTLPLGGRVAKRALDIENQVTAPGDNPPLFWMDVVARDYFNVMNISVVAGRSFSPADDSGNPPVVILSAATARRFWPGQNVIGTHIRLSSEQEWREVIGVVADVRAYDLQHSVPDWINGTIYLPYNEKATLEGERVPSDMTVVVQTKLDESQMQETLRGAILGLGAEIPVSEVKPMHVVVSESVSTSASTTALFVAFASLALILGAIGIYGVLSFLVSTRTREIGVRLALGASPRDVVWLVLKEGAQFCVTGVVLGLVCAFALTRLLSSQLYGVSPADPLTFFAAAVLMVLVTLLACYVPTRRAMRVDPIVALHYD